MPREQEARESRRRGRGQCRDAPPKTLYYESRASRRYTRVYFLLYATKSIYLCLYCTYRSYTYHSLTPYSANNTYTVLSGDP